MSKLHEISQNFAALGSSDYTSKCVPWWLSDKESACSAGDVGLIPGSGRPPEEENGNPLQHSCLGKFHGQRSLAVTVHGVAV